MKLQIIMSLLLFAGACTTDADADASKDKSPTKAATTSRPTKDAGKAAPAATKVSHVDGAGAAKLIADDSSLTILDIRTPAEYAEGHIKGSVNIDFKASDFAAKLKDLDKEKKYLVHCRSGGRSTSSLATFQELGFHDIIHLDGGFLDWEKAGQPVEK